MPAAVDIILVQLGGIDQVAVAALFLGQVEHFVRQGHGGLVGGGMFGKRRGTDGAGQTDAFQLSFVGKLHVAADLPEEGPQGRLAGDILGDDEHLVAPQSAHHAVVANGLVDDFRKGHQHRIAVHMAIGVVYHFEIIQVQNHQVGGQLRVTEPVFGVLDDGPLVQHIQHGIFV